MADYTRLQRTFTTGIPTVLLNDTLIGWTHPHDLHIRMVNLGPIVLMNMYVHPHAHTVHTVQLHSTYQMVDACCPIHIYIHRSGVSGMLYVHQVCQGCCTYIRCVRDVACTSGVSGMLHVHQVCQGCCTYIRCVRDVVRTSGMSGVLYIHQVCQGCCMYIRCVRDVVRTSGVSGMLYAHQVCYIGHFIQTGSCK